MKAALLGLGMVAGGAVLLVWGLRLARLGESFRRVRKSARRALLRQEMDRFPVEDYFR